MSFEINGKTYETDEEGYLLNLAEHLRARRPGEPGAQLGSPVDRGRRGGRRRHVLGVAPQFFDHR